MLFYDWLLWQAIAYGNLNKWLLLAMVVVTYQILILVLHKKKLKSLSSLSNTVITPFEPPSFVQHLPSLIVLRSGGMASIMTGLCMTRLTLTTFETDVDDVNG